QILLEQYNPKIPEPTVQIDPACLEIRKENFTNKITFHAPGLRRYKTTEYETHDVTEFVSISLTGTNCALSCDHCKTSVLKGMTDFTQFDRSLFELCADLAEDGAKGVLISGGSDKMGRVPLLQHIPDLKRVREELGLAIRVHPGLPDEETIAGLAKIGIDGAMVDIIGHQDTIRDVYHLDATPNDYNEILANLNKYEVPSIPHIILGLHFGKMLGEETALEMIVENNPKILVLVVLMPLNGTPMYTSTPPSLDEIGSFFELARKSLPDKPVMLGCARPLGPMKPAIDKLAVDAGLNGIAYPAEGIVNYALEQELEPNFINACCGVSW
ncbi:MAG: radical SAM protein, partial [Chloroflexota bacterium]